MRGHQHDWSGLQISTDLANRKIRFCVSLHGVTRAVRRLFRCGEWISYHPAEFRGSRAIAMLRLPAKRRLARIQTDEGRRSVYGSCERARQWAAEDLNQ